MHTRTPRLQCLRKKARITKLIITQSRAPGVRSCTVVVGVSSGSGPTDSPSGTRTNGADSASKHFYLLLLISVVRIYRCPDTLQRQPEKPPYMSGIVKGILEDYLVDKANDYAGEHFQPVRDPFYTRDARGNESRLTLSKDRFTKRERRAWKSLQSSAWVHDQNMCGCCCVGTSCVGWAPALAILPVVGPLLMYNVHRQLIAKADSEFKLPTDLKAKMYGNIGVDLAVSLVPILGIALSWMNAASTRNLAMVYNYIVQRRMEEQALSSPQQPIHNEQVPLEDISQRRQREEHWLRQQTHLGHNA